MDVVTLQLAKQYAAETATGAGAIKGDKGDKGDPGPQGPVGPVGPTGDDGVSPTITVADIPGGHRVTITDADGPHSFDVMDGEDGDVTQGQLDAVASEVSALANAVQNIENAMYQPGTYTTYTVTITPATAVTGPITEATVSAVLGDTALAGLTPSGTDDAGNSLYDCVINGVTTGSYAKIDKLSAVMAGINGSSARVSVGYDQAENVVTFTAKLSGACVDIVFGDGLATALFDPPSGIDFGSKIFIDVYSGLGWLNDADDGTTVQVTFSTPMGDIDLPISKTSTVSYVVSSLNTAFGGQMTTSCDKHTGEIIIKDGTGQRVDLSITDSGGDPITFKASSAPPDPYTYGKDAVFVAVKVNGTMQPITDKTVDIAVPTKASQLVNDSGYQTQAQVSEVISSLIRNLTGIPENVPMTYDQTANMLTIGGTPGSGFLTGIAFAQGPSANTLTIAGGSSGRISVLPANAAIVYDAAAKILTISEV